MATDFNNGVLTTTGGLKPSRRNTPIDVRTRIETISEIGNIPLPYVGMIFYVISEKEYYKVISLKSKVIAGRPQEDSLINEYKKLVDLSGLATEDYVLGKIANIELTPGEQGPMGPQGPAGADGAKGEQGEVGPQGPAGKDGIQGVDGADGKSAYQIAVEEGFAGTETEWIASLKGEKGDQGIQGEVGPQGPAGKDGIQGVDGADGKSAYQIAVEEGFAGTEAEWLISLKGTNGAQGEQGPKGETGAVGPQGPAGKDGTNGIFNIDEVYEMLTTTDKSVLGAINEIKAMLDKLTVNLPVGTPMYYGFIPYEISGVVDNYNQISYEMALKAKDTLKTVTAERVGKVDLGMVTEGSLIVIAVPSAYKFQVTKDNGLGGRYPFATDVCGANGVDVVWNGISYKLYGELLLVTGQMYGYVE